jgi:hypothetical protein
MLVGHAAPLNAQQRGQQGLTAAANAVLWIDYSQTMWARSRGWSETNVVLGRRPSAVALSLYTGAWMAANTWAPRRLRPWVQLVVLAVEGYAIAQNVRQGAPVRVLP